MRRLFALVSLLALLVAAAPVNAQTPAGTLLITEVDSAAFPAMTVYLTLNDAAGKHIPGLGADSFSLSEGLSPVAGLTVAEQSPGVRVAFVLDPSPPFNARDVNAVTRLDYLKQALTDFTSNWMQADADEATILIPDGEVIARSSAPPEVSAAVAALSGPLGQAPDPLPLLNRALDYAAEAALRPGMRRYVVFISNGLVIGGQQLAINDLSVRARAAQVTLHTVYVGAAEGAELPGAQGLVQLAGLTRGTAYTFDKPDSLTPLFQLLADQRTQYVLTYRSALNATGQHDLTATVKLADGSQVTSEPRSVALRIEPPHITWGDVPAQMEQAAAPVPIPFTVDFPDGHARELHEFQLVVDDETVDRQATETGILHWPTAGYAQSGEHILIIRVTDELGLAGESAPLTVAVNVGTSASALAAWTVWQPMVLAVLGGAGLLLAIGLIVVLRRRAARPEPAPVTLTQPAAPHTAPSPPSAPAAAPAPERGAPPAPESPSPAPLLHVPGETRPVKPVSIAPKPLVDKSPSRAAPATAPEKKEMGRAYFEVLEAGGGGAARPDIEILKPTLKLGRDPAQAEIAFDDRSVSRLHARLEEWDGVYKVYDEHSTSGTWVNLEQIPDEGGRELRDGDVVNLGRVQLRFRRRG